VPQKGGVPLSIAGLTSELRDVAVTLAADVPDETIENIDRMPERLFQQVVIMESPPGAG
jgi:hypothetical protein